MTNNSPANDANNPPALPPELTPEAVAERIASWPRKTARYINARLADPDRTKVSIAQELGLSDAYPWQWGRDVTLPNGYVVRAVPGFRELDDAITNGRIFLRQELARDFMLRHAPLIAERAVERALWQDEPDTKAPNGQVVQGKKLTDRRLQVSHQAGMAVLEVSGVISKAPIIQIDNRRIDVRAMDLWQQGGAEAWRKRNQPTLPAAEEKSAEGGLGGSKAP